MFFDEKHVMIHDCTIVWDGITRPETIAQGKNAGQLKYSLKVVIPPNSPDLVDMNQLAQTTLQQSQFFQGVLPAGGYMPLGTAGPTEFNGMFPGWCVMNVKSNRIPDVFDEGGIQLHDPMQFNPRVYPGQKVDILVHCYDYNDKSKGVSAGLDGFRIIASAQAPRLQFGAGRVDSAAAFGAGAGPQPAPVAQPGQQQQPQQQQPLPGAPAPVAPVQQATGYLPPRQ